MTPTLAMMATECHHPPTFSSNHRACAASVFIKPPRYLLYVTIFRPYPQKKTSSHGTFCGDTTRMLLFGYRK